MNNPPANAITIQQAAAAKGVAEHSIRQVLRNGKRKAVIFPSAVFTGTKERGMWHLDPVEVEMWQPRRAKGGK